MLRFDLPLWPNPTPAVCEEINKIYRKYARSIVTPIFVDQLV